MVALALALLLSTAASPLAATAAPAAAIRTFLGQRYAEPPLGPRRLAPATVKAFNESSLDPGGSTKVTGTKGSACTQSSGGAEDCLFANIYAPLDSLPADAGGRGTAAPVPVFFWIHGGGWTAGSGNDYDGTVLASGQGIVVVCINYRLGGLGFFASEQIAAAPGSLNATGGMNGILDMVVALQWAQKNVHRFGGDPSQLTIAGESAGAEAVCNLLVSPVAKGLFRRAIIESGPCITGLHGWGPHSGVPDPNDDSAPEGYLAVSEKLAQHITGEQQPTLADLRAVQDARAFINSTSIKDSIDNYVIPTNPIEYFRDGRLNAMEVMLGGNSFDGLETYYIKYMQNPLTHMMPHSVYESRMLKAWGPNTAAVQAVYPVERFGGNTNPADVMPNGDASVICPTLEIAALITQAGGTAFSFHFQYGPVCSDVAGKMKTGPHWASHASELAWVWGYEPACYRNASEVALTTLMQDYWGSFTRTGQPQASLSARSSAAVWLPWTAERGNTMVLDLNASGEVAHLKEADCQQLHAINASFWPTGIRQGLP